jgi:hypothetical protein
VVCNRVLPGEATEEMRREGHGDLAGMIILGGYARTAQGPQVGPARDCAVGVLRPHQKVKVPYRSLRVLVEIAIILILIGKVITCQWLTNCLVFSSV